MQFALKMKYIFVPLDKQSIQNISVCQFLIIQSNDKSLMDRLFGKQLSNLLGPELHNKTRHIGRVHSQSTRVPSDDHAKLGIKRFNRSSFGQNQSQKTQRQELTTSALINESKAEVKQPKDVQLVQQYFEDCFKFMLNQQSNHHRMKNYIAHQTQINEKMRGILLDWLFDLHLKFKMFPQTLYAMTMIIDMYLSKKDALKQNLQLIGTAAFYIAAKYQQTYQVPQIDDLVHFAAKAFTKSQLVEMEAEIIQMLQFNLIMETSFRFFQPLSKVCKMDPKNFHLAQYVLELSLLETKFLDFKPSLIASSAIYLINKIRKRPESWPHELESLTGYAQKDLKYCARDLCNLLQKADDVPNNKSLKKKFSLSQYNQVTRIKLERKKQ